MLSFQQYSEVIFWNFKRMDNANYNFEIIESLIDSACQSGKKTLHSKPIIFLIMSIVECALYDLLLRIKEHVYESINIAPEDIKIIKATNIPDALQSYTDICKKYELLGADYQKLNKFIPIRNRVHIQNIKAYHPPDEYQLWSSDLTKECGVLLKDIFVYMCEKYPRTAGQFHSEPDLTLFPEPWNKL
jgi:hypothetical protein